MLKENGRVSKGREFELDDERIYKILHERDNQNEAVNIKLVAIQVRISNMTE